MKYTQFCNYCNQANAIPRVYAIMECIDDPDSVIKEYKWVCPKCNSVVRIEKIKEKK